MLSCLLSILLEQLVGSTVVSCLSQLQRHTAVVLTIVVDMSLAELIIAVVHGVPDIVDCSVQIVCSLIDGMLVETVETGLVDDVDNRLLGLGDGKC